MRELLFTYLLRTQIFFSALEALVGGAVSDFVPCILGLACGTALNEINYSVTIKIQFATAAK